MKHLSGLDASFLFLETAEMPMHVGALHVFALPRSYRGNFVDDMRRHMASRLPLAPVLCRKPVFMPLNLANPVWADAEPDLEQHIVAIHLPKGSGRAELEAQVGLLHPVLLARDRPLWKFHVFDGLAPGPKGEKRFGLYTQLHHAAVDGQAAVALARAILDLGPVPAALPAVAPRQTRGPLGVAKLLRAALANQLEQVSSLVRAVPAAAGALSQMASGSAGTLARSAGQGKLSLAPRTRLNTTVSAQRAFAGTSLPLEALNPARRRHQASLNDAVLMVCSGALRRFFGAHPPLPRKSLVAGVPISLRAAGDASANNQASMTMLSLGTHLADPAARLAHVMAASAAMKRTLGGVKNLLPTDFPSLGVPWVMSALAQLSARTKVADRLPAIVNLTISNVPGPTMPLYMAGAKMLSNHPTSIVVHGVALNVTVQTYNDALDVGIIACAKAMPEVAEFAHCIDAAWKEFEALVPAAAAPAAKAPTPRKVAARKSPTATKPHANRPTKPRAATPIAPRARR